MTKPTCEICGREFKTQNALGSHTTYAHGGSGTGAPPGVAPATSEDPEIQKLSKDLKLVELGSKLKQAKAAAEAREPSLRQDFDTLVRRVDAQDTRLQEQADILRAQDARIKAAELEKDILGSITHQHIELAGVIGEVQKILALRMVQEGWKISYDPFGNPCLNGMSDAVLSYLVEQGKITLVNTHRAY